jgi:hypothetical protein
MGIKAKFTKADIQRILEVKTKRIDQAVVNRLIKTGEEFVRMAREKGSYNDITGNLRSSVGYVVLDNGKRVAEDLQLSERGSDKQGGLNKAKAHIQDVISRYVTGKVLVGFAGMEYAASVESRGKDVITSSAINAERTLKEALRNLGKKL